MVHVVFTNGEKSIVTNEKFIEFWNITLKNGFQDYVSSCIEMCIFWFV